jgi:hypothetical protein
LYEYEWMDSSEKLTQIFIPPIGSLLMWYEDLSW